MGRLMKALDGEWRELEHGAAGVRTLRHWAGEDARYSPFHDLGQLRDHFEQRDLVHDRDSLMADLLRRSPSDEAARRLLLAVFRPGLARLARRASAFWDGDDAESIVIATAIERLSDPSASVPVNVPSGVLGGVWSAVWAVRMRERREIEPWGGRLDPSALEAVEAPQHGDGTATLLRLVEEAVQRGALTTRGARLMVLHWVHGLSNGELAELDGLRPCTIRKHRRQAELRLAEFAA